MSRWDAARAANGRRAYKPVGPVGERLASTPWEGPINKRYTIGPYDVSTCHGCGYHVCDCRPEAPLAVSFTLPIKPSSEEIAKFAKWMAETWGL